MTPYVLVLACLLAAEAAESPVDPVFEQGERHLDEGRPKDADRVFRELLAADPSRIDVRDALIRALLALGDPEAAAREADARLALTPDDDAWQARRLYVLGLAPSRRSEAIAGYRALLAARPDDADALVHLALFLSWTPGQLQASVATWRRALAVAPDDPRARLGLARTLAWTGESVEAAARFDAILARNPRELDALLGRSQVARWTGDQRRARAFLLRAEAVGPGDARVVAERARLELDAGRHGIAYATARSAERLSPGLYEAHEALAAIDEATAPRGALRVTGTDESTSFRRTTVSLPVEFRPLADTRLRFQPALTRFQGTEDLQRLSLGAEVRQSGLPQGLYGRAAYGLHVLGGAGRTHGIELELGSSRPLDLPVQVRIGARQRALVDLPPGDEGIATLNAIGSGGGTVEAVGLEVREAYAGVVVAPIHGLYLYGDATTGEIDGTNPRRSVAAGAGQDLLQAFGVSSAHALTLRYDLYVLAVETPSLLYFSPSSFVAHTPGAEWRWTWRDRVTVGVEGGVPLQAGSPPGWLAGAFSAIEVGDRVVVEARARTMDDTVYRATGATVGLTGRL